MGDEWLEWAARDFGNRQQIHVVHFSQCWLPQTETWLYNQIRFLPPDIHSSVVCQWTANLDQFPASNLYSLQSPPRVTSLLERFAQRLGLWDEQQRHLGLLEDVIKTVKPNVLHSHFGQCGWVNYRLARKHRLAHVVSFYGLDLSYLPRVDHRWPRRYRRMSEYVDLILCEGPHMAATIAKFGVDVGKIKVCRLGIDLSCLPFVSRKRCHGRRIRFLIAGSFREKKGIPYALEALGLFSSRHPDIEITIIGDAGKSEREEQEKRKILFTLEQMGLSARTRMLGYQPHSVLIGEFYKHDIFVSPSVTSSDGDTEGGAPVTIIEAAATGMPVVSTSHCDIPFVLSKRNRPYLVSEGDSVLLEQAIEKLTQSDDWELLGLANRLFIERELDVRHQAATLAQLYECVSSSNSGRREHSPPSTND